MRNYPTAEVVLITAMLFGVAHAAVVEPIPVTGKIRWVHSYADGQRLARQTGKPMFVVFRCER